MLCYPATVLAIVNYCLRLFNIAMAMVVMGDTCVQSIMAIMHYYQATVLVIVINCQRLFAVFIFVVAMAMAVMGDMCVESITAICTIIRHYVGDSD